MKFHIRIQCFFFQQRCSPRYMLEMAFYLFMRNLLHDPIREDSWEYATSLIHLLLIDMSIPRKESERSCMQVLQYLFGCSFCDCSIRFYSLYTHLCCTHGVTYILYKVSTNQGRIQDFKIGGALKIIGPSGARRENFLGISCEKSRLYAKKIIFFPILCAPAPGSVPAN